MSPAPDSVTRGVNSRPDLRAPAAFEALFRAHFDFVHANLRRLGVAPAAVDDAVQEVFLVVLRRADTPVAWIRAWLFGIVRRVAWRYRRSAARRHRLVEALTLEPARPSDFPAAVDRRDAEVLLDRFLAGLDEAKREVFVLAELEEMTAPEIARALEIKENTVYSRLRAARQEFDRSLARARVRDEREHMLARGRRAHAPDFATRERAWLCLLATLGAGGALAESTALVAAEAAATGSAAGGQAVWALVVGALGLAVVAAGPSRADPPAPTEVPALIASRTGPTEHVVEDIFEQTPSDPPAPTEAAGPAPRVPAATRRPVRPPPPPAAVPRHVSQDMPRLTPAAAPQHVYKDMTQEPPTTLTADTLAREAALMSAARAALRARAWDRARALLDAHAREFPTGALVEERQLSRITALCAGGEPDLARAEQARIQREQPGTALARKALALCDDAGEHSSTNRDAAGD